MLKISSFESLAEKGVEFVRRHKRRYEDCKSTGVSCTVVPELLKAQDGMYEAVSEAYCSSCPYRSSGEENPVSYNPISFRSAELKRRPKRK